jgi:Gpi18-like mannosyltransferase
MTVKTEIKNVKETWQIDLHSFYVGLAISLALHLLLINLPIAFSIDMNLFKAWSIWLVQQGFGNFYNYSNCDYPPAYLYVLWAIGKTYQLFDPDFAHTGGVLFTAMIKLPSVLANIGAAILIVIILKPYTTESRAYAIALIYALNPLIIFVSAVWGQVDGVMIFLMLWAFALIQKNHVIRSGLLIAVMAIVKPLGIFIAPFLFLSQWFRQVWWTGGAIALGGVSLIWLIILPFYGMSANGALTPFLGLYQRLQSTANYYDFASVNAFNIWGWANWVHDYTTFAGISYKVIGLALLGILILWLGFFLYQQRDQESQFPAHCLAAATMLIGFFMFPTRMHERYMLYSIAFMAISIAVIPIVKWIYWGFTVTGVVNVGYVYLRYNHEALYNAITEAWLQTVIYGISAFNVILFLILLFQTIRFPKTQSASGGARLLH